MLSGEIKYVNIHAHRKSLSEEEWVLTSLMIEECDKEVLSEGVYSIGLHPWSIGKIDLDAELQKLYLLAADSRVLAIGELGLDKHISTDFELQKEVFAKQISLAVSLQKPLIIHNVRSWQEILQHKKQHEEVKMLIHGFMGGKELAEEMVRQGFYLSVGPRGIKNEKLKSALGSIPPDRLFLETDVDDTSIGEHYKNVSKILGLDEALLVSRFKDNLNEFFGINDG